MSENRITGNAQGFELPRGCMMTAGVILMVVVGVTCGLLAVFGG